jgi:hypothetical protein
MNQAPSGATSWWLPARDGRPQGSNMPPLMGLENVLGCDFYNDFAPDGAGGWRDFIWTKFLRGSNFKL